MELFEENTKTIKHTSMNIDTDIDDLMNELMGFTTDLEVSVMTKLDDIASRLPAEIISGLETAEKNLNGTSKRPSKGLRGSIVASVEQGQLQIGMNYYGYFQIFGVQGNGVNALELGVVADQFNGKSSPSDKFQFGTSRKGISPSPLAANQIINLVDILEQTILEKIEI